MKQIEDEEGIIYTTYDKYEVTRSILMRRTGDVVGLSDIGITWRTLAHAVRNPSIVRVNNVVKLCGQYDLGELETTRPIISKPCSTLYVDESGQYIMCMEGNSIKRSKIFYDDEQMLKLIKNNFDIISQIVKGYYITLVTVNSYEKPYRYFHSSLPVIHADDKYLVEEELVYITPGMRYDEFIEQYNEMELHLDVCNRVVKAKYR